MNTKRHLSLVKNAENITQNELNNAPELPILAALDATLLATLRMMEFHYLPPTQNDETETIGDLENDLVRSICDMSKWLRGALSTYYSVVQLGTPERSSAPILDDIPF